MADQVASTQEQLDILDIQSDLILLKQGGAALVIQANAVNFDLLSEKEQDAMIAAYSGLLNSLSFHIQILIRSRKMDISAYVKHVDQVAQTHPNPYLREQILSYKEFVQGLVQKGEVLDKRFYIVIPYYEFGGESSGGPMSALTGSKPKPRTVNKAALLQRAKTDLDPKQDHLIKQLNKLGIKSKQLTTPELIELFYEIYNPKQSKVQHLDEGISQYTTPLVEPNVAAQAPPPPAQGEGPAAQAPPPPAQGEGPAAQAPPPPSGTGGSAAAPTPPPAAQPGRGSAGQETPGSGAVQGGQATQGGGAVQPAGGVNVRE
jgi:hypothetical protein